MGRKLSKKTISKKALSLDKRRETYLEIKKEFSSFINFGTLKKEKRSPKVIKKGLLYLRSGELEENAHSSGIENCNSDFMLEEIGRGMIRYSRRISWLLRHYEWASRVPNSGERAKVLDLGCDVGEIRKVMSRSFYYPNPLYVGVDIDHERLSQGFFLVETRTPMMYIQHDITFDLGFVKSNSVDVIFLGETIEHFEKKYGRKLLKEMKRVLVKGGIFLISTPNKKNSKGYDFHVYEYTPEELYKLIEECGLTVRRRYGWITTERVLEKRMKPEDRDFYYRLRENAVKDICLPIMAHMHPDYADAFCVEGIKEK